MRACVVGSATNCTDPEDFEGGELEFVQDVTETDDENYPAGGMPPDDNYPERAIFGGGPTSHGGDVVNFEFEFKLPDGLSGEQVLLQWKYTTANSCSPPGYEHYFTVQHPQLPDWYWGGSNLAKCTPPYPPDGTRRTNDKTKTWPERELMHFNSSNTYQMYCM